MALARCILGKFLGVGCHCFPPPLDVTTFSARCLHIQRCERPLVAEGGTLRGRKMFRRISSRIRLTRNSRDLLHASNLRHGTDGFTSPPKEDFFTLKNPTASAGFEPANLGTKGQHATSRPPKPILRHTYTQIQNGLELWSFLAVRLSVLLLKEWFYIFNFPWNQHSNYQDGVWMYSWMVHYSHMLWYKNPVFSYTNT